MDEHRNFMEKKRLERTAEALRKNRMEAFVVNSAAEVAAPANTHRLQLKPPCATTGECNSCNSPARICCTELLLGPQQNPSRVKVILVCEDLGY